MGTRYLITYDIRNERRLAQVAKIMEGYGRRVQKSIFEALLTPADLRNLKLDLLQEMDPVDDGIKFFRLCERCEQRVTIIGLGENPDLREEVIIV